MCSGKGGGGGEGEGEEAVDSLAEFGQLTARDRERGREEESGRGEYKRGINEK